MTGIGHNVRGEVHRILVSLLSDLDEFERCPVHYHRERILCKLFLSRYISVILENDNSQTVQSAFAYFNQTSKEKYYELRCGKYPFYPEYTLELDAQYIPREGNHLRLSEKIVEADRERELEYIIKRNKTSESLVATEFHQLQYQSPSLMYTSSTASHYDILTPPPSSTNNMSSSDSFPSPSNNISFSTTVLSNDTITLSNKNISNFQKNQKGADIDDNENISLHSTTLLPKMIIIDEASTSMSTSPSINNLNHSNIITEGGYSLQMENKSVS